jgi:altronate hydrolase
LRREPAKAASPPCGGSPTFGVSLDERVTEKGFVYMDTPGYDPVAATGQVAGGANLICFTTGRGSAFGAKPSLDQARHQHRHLQEDGGRHGHQLRRRARRVSIEAKGEEIFAKVLAVASGERTKSEELGYGDA